MNDYRHVAVTMIQRLSQVQIIMFQSQGKGFSQTVNSFRVNNRIMGCFKLNPLQGARVQPALIELPS